MATVAKKHEPYPWTKWFRRKHFTLTRGKHYHCQTHGMVAQVRSAGLKQRPPKRVSVEVVETTIIVTVL